MYCMKCRNRAKWLGLWGQTQKSHVSGPDPPILTLVVSTPAPFWVSWRLCRLTWRGRSGQCTWKIPWESAYWSSLVPAGYPPHFGTNLNGIECVCKLICHQNGAHYLLYSGKDFKRKTIYKWAVSPCHAGTSRYSSYAWSPQTFYISLYIHYFKPNVPGFQGSMIQNSLNETSVPVGN